MTISLTTFQNTATDITYVIDVLDYLFSRSTITSASSNSATLEGVYAGENIFASVSGFAMSGQQFNGQFSLTSGVMQNIIVSVNGQNLFEIDTSIDIGLLAQIVSDDNSGRNIRAIEDFLQGQQWNIQLGNGSDLALDGEVVGFDNVRYNLQGNDIINTGSGNDNFFSGDGNDVFFAGLGNDTFNGGNGMDTVLFSGSSSNYTLSGSQDVLVTDNAFNRDGQDLLVNVERLDFTDGTLALDVEAGENAGTAYRIYQAAFARTPDNGGLSYWTEAIDNGMSLYQVASGFVHSNEFKFVYGFNPSNLSIVERLYENVLGRQGEAAGVDYWTSELDYGYRDTASVLAGFSESQENIANVSATISDGIWLY